MENILIRISFAACLLTLALLINACSTRNVSMQLLVPAKITIPQEIRTVAILNRSLPARKEQIINILEGFITGESILADREGSFNCIRGVESRMNESPRIKAIAIETDTYRGTGTKMFPEMLNWNDVDALCREYKVDAILSLETFDSDFGLRQYSSDRKEKVNGKEVTTKVYHADLAVNVTSGWRLYDNIGKTMVDQVSFSDEKKWKGEGNSAANAEGKLPAKRNSINESGRYAGFLMANRLSPNWRKENRSYYIKGNDDFKKAKKEVKFNNWDAAIAIWKKISDNTDPVLAGRACYNLALASEMKGNLEMAIFWADKAMKQYHDKKARSYVDVLNNRIQNEEKLKEQMQ